MSRLGRWLVAVLITLTTVPLAAQNEFRERYRRGVEAFASGRWAEVVREMNGAIGERGEERAGSGLLARRYTPRYYLAGALAAQGDCRAAMPVFAEAEGLGQIQKTPDWNDFQRRQRECQTLLEQVDRAATDARAAVAQASSDAEPLAALRGDVALIDRWNQGEPSLADAEDHAARLLRRAKDQLEDGTRNDRVGALAEAKRSAEEAGSAYRDLVAEARSMLAAVGRATASALESAEAVFARARRALRGIRDLAPYPRQLESRVAAVESLIERFDARGPRTSPAALGDLETQVTTALDALARAARRPPRALQDAVEAYLRGDHEAAVEALTDANYNETRARIHTCLLRAASLDVLQMTAGVEDPRWSAAIDDCRSLDPAPEPDPRFFSPGFARRLAQALATPPIDVLPSAEAEAASDG